jgi:hypothetical protein
MARVSLNTPGQRGARNLPLYKPQALLLLPAKCPRLPLIH